MRPFSALVRQARDAGYTEPDPRDDLSGEDVRRKTVILARAAGFEIEPGDVEVASLVPRALTLLSKHAVDGALPALDAPLRQRYADAYKRAGSAAPQALAEAIRATNIKDNAALSDGIQFDAKGQNNGIKIAGIQNFDGEAKVVLPLSSGERNIVFPVPGWQQRR